MGIFIILACVMIMSWCFSSTLVPAMRKCREYRISTVWLRNEQNKLLEFLASSGFGSTIGSNVKDWSDDDDGRGYNIDQRTPVEWSSRFNSNPCAQSVITKQLFDQFHSSPPRDDTDTGRDSCRLHGWATHYHRGTDTVKLGGRASDRTSSFWIGQFGWNVRLAPVWVQVIVRWADTSACG